MIPFLQRLEKSCVLVHVSADQAEGVDEVAAAQKEIKFEWFENEDVESILSRFAAQLSQAAAQLQVPVRSALHIEKVVNPSRSPDSLDHEVLLQVVNFMQSYGLREAIFKDNCEYMTTSAGAEGLSTLTALDVTACGLTEVPEVFSNLINLRTLTLRRNKLTSLPSFLGSVLKQLTHLDADDNLITTLPESLKDLTNLHTLSLSNNRLKAPIVNLSNLNSLCVLHLGGNPLQYFPELSQAPSLLTVSLANLLVVAEPSWASWSVEMLSQRTSRLSMRPNSAASVNDTMKLLLSRSSVQHPLIAGGLAEMAADEDFRTAMLKAEGLLPQLVHAMLSENIIVAEKCCETLCKLTTTKEVAIDVEKASAISAAHELVFSPNERLKKCGLAVLNELALASEEVAFRALRQKADSGGSDLLADLMSTIKQQDAEVQCSVLLTLSTLAFPRTNKVKILQADGCLALLKDLAAKKPGGEAADANVRMAALRSLSVLGRNDLVDAANGKPPIRGRGLRVLALDGGGMKGMTEVTILRELEKRTGKRMHELFDVIGGTSTGCMLAMACGVMQFTMDEMEEVYMALGTRIFAASAKDAPPAAAAQEPVATPSSQSWSEGLMRLYRSGEQGMRVAMYGAKHNTPLFEQLLKEKTHLQSIGPLNDMAIDANCLPGPKVFRTYEFTPGPDEEQRAQRLALHTGSSKHKLWQAIRASSAAPYYLDDFSVGEERFIDGAVSVNNPSVVAVQEARMLYPHLNIDCFVSLGVGLENSMPRARGMSSYFETGSAMIEGASNPCRPHEALACTLDMADCVYERFCPVDARCGIPLDCTDEKMIAGLVQATEEYLAANAVRLQRVCDILKRGCDDSLEVDRSLQAGDCTPTATAAVILAAPVSASCMAGQLVSAAQGLQHTSVIDLKQLTMSASDAEASTTALQPPGACTLTSTAAGTLDATQVLPSTGRDAESGFQVRQRAAKGAREAAGSGCQPLALPDAECQAQTNNSSSAPCDSHAITPTSDGNNAECDTGVLAHAGDSVAKGPAQEGTQAAAPGPGARPSLPALNTTLSATKSNAQNAYEDIPAVQEMVHTPSRLKETPTAAQSPSSGLLGMLVSMVSTSISPKRDSSSMQHPTGSTFVAASPSGSASVDARSSSSTCAEGPGEGSAAVTIAATQGTQDIAPFDDNLPGSSNAEVIASQVGVDSEEAVASLLPAPQGLDEAPIQVKDPLDLLHTSHDIGFIVVAGHFVGEGVVSRFRDSMFQVLGGSKEAQALQARLCNPGSDGSSGSCDAAAAAPDTLGTVQEPVQAVDGSGAWYKCVLKHSQAISCPGDHAPVHISTLLMQEFKPDSIWPLQELQRLLRKTKAVVILPPASPDVLAMVMDSGAIACLVAKPCVDEVGNVEVAAGAALSGVQVVERVRAGLSLHNAMLLSNADKYFDLMSA